MLAAPAPAPRIAAALAAALAQPALVDPQRGEEIPTAVIKVAASWRPLGMTQGMTEGSNDVENDLPVSPSSVVNNSSY